MARRVFGLPGFVWLDSAAPGQPAHDYSYITARPIATFRWNCGRDKTAMDMAFRSWLSRFAAEPVEGGCPFQGGAIGYLSYDYALHASERIGSRHPVSSGACIEFGLYDTILAFDHVRRELWIYCAGFLESGGRLKDSAIDRNIRDLAELVSGEAPAKQSSQSVWDAWAAHPSQQAYQDNVREVHENILDGEIYQANIAHLWERPAAGIEAAFKEYLAVRSLTQAPFSSFCRFETRTLSCFSPERLVSMDAGRKVRAEPIKGTARRSQDAAGDEQAAEMLRQSAKDRAENIMIVDLLRNDLSRVCEPQSVEVTRLCEIERLPNIFHLVSTIEGRLRNGADVVDLLNAVFPGGSVTGAPKLRAMEIIDALEPASRGAFCGSLGYIGYDGACDFNIMIRTIEHLDGLSRYWSGAGLTLSSDPEQEWREVQLKAERILGLGEGRAVAQ